MTFLKKKKKYFYFIFWLCWVFVIAWPQAAVDTAEEKETPQVSLLTVREVGSHPRLV